MIFVELGKYRSCSSLLMLHDAACLWTDKWLRKGTHAEELEVQFCSPLPLAPPCSPLLYRLSKR